MKRSDGAPDIDLPKFTGRRVAIVVARFYPELADWLVDGARRAALACGVKEEDLLEYAVPGCFELPLAVKRLINADEKIDCAVALGVVVRGETPHFDYVAGECARGIMQINLITNVPVGFGVLTTENVAQAAERADPARGDKGFEAMVAALAVLAISDKKVSTQTLGIRN
jgi:6,7-dimethyl-8-ribityllumazine synthase